MTQDEKQRLVCLLGSFYDMPREIERLLREAAYWEAVQRGNGAAAERCRAEAARLIQKAERLARARDSVEDALESLNRRERAALEFVYMGSRDPKARENWTGRPPWKIISARLELSENHAQAFVGRILEKLREAMHDG